MVAHDATFLNHALDVEVPQIGPASSEIQTRNISPLIRRQRIFLATACVATLISSAGWAATALVKSPAQRAAERAAPPASVLTAPVVKKVLQNTVIARGAMVPGQSIPVTPSAPTAGGGLLITGVPKKVGDKVSNGDVVLQVSGRPVIALVGRIPAYRDMRPGSDGPDVAQMQAALHQLGIADDDRTGMFGQGTKDGVKALYARLGYEATTVGETDPGTGQSLLKPLQTAVVQARRAIDERRVLLTAATGAAAEAKAQRQLGNAEEDLQTATYELEQARARSGVQLPQSEIVFVPTVPAAIASIKALVGATLPLQSGPALTIDVGQLMVTSVLPPGQQQLLRPGMKVSVEDEVNHRFAQATVTSIGNYTSDTPATGADPGTPQNPPGGSPRQTGFPLLAMPTKPLPRDWLNANVRLTIVQGSSAGPVLVVPAAAILTDMNGGHRVTVIDVNGAQHPVPVAVGADADGEVEVSAKAGAELREGDRVVTG
jgi:HlyD family secretion protein